MTLSWNKAQERFRSFCVDVQYYLRNRALVTRLQAMMAGTRTDEGCRKGAGPRLEHNGMKYRMLH